MAVASLKYKGPSASSSAEETRSGFIIFSGSATEYESWLFRSQVKIASVKTDDDGNPDADCYRRTIANIVESLRGDALQVVSDLGLTVVMQPTSGFDKLASSLRDFIFPLAEEEAKHLYREFHRGHSLLWRQPNESMVSY